MNVKAERKYLMEHPSLERGQVVKATSLREAQKKFQDARLKYGNERPVTVKTTLLSAESKEVPNE